MSNKTTKEILKELEGMDVKHFITQFDYMISQINGLSDDEEIAPLDGAIIFFAKEAATRDESLIPHLVGSIADSANLSDMLGREAISLAEQLAPEDASELLRKIANNESADSGARLKAIERLHDMDCVTTDDLDRWVVDPNEKIGEEVIELRDSKTRQQILEVREEANDEMFEIAKNKSLSPKIRACALRNIKLEGGYQLLLDLLDELLQDEEKEVREAACSIAEQSVQTTNMLFARLNIEESTDVRTSMLWALIDFKLNYNMDIADESIEVRMRDRDISQMLEYGYKESLKIFVQRVRDERVGKTAGSEPPRKKWPKRR